MFRRSMAKIILRSLLAGCILLAVAAGFLVVSLAFHKTGKPDQRQQTRTGSTVPVERFDCTAILRRDGSAEITEVLNSEAKVYVSDAGMDGGWTAPETPAVTEDARKALTGATSELEGAQYNPVALLGTQLVAGTNYCLLCEITPVVPNAESHYAVVIVYDGVDGTTSITDTFDFAAAE